MRDGGWRRLLSGLAALALVATLGGCGSTGGGGSTTAAAERASDATILNEVLARQEAAAVAYQKSMRGLREPVLAIARRFEAQEQEHVDATVRALRGIGEAAEPQREDIMRGHPRTQKDYLTLLYEVENATIQLESDAIGRLTEPAARKLLAATVANQAQRLVLLRRALGWKPIETVPSAFENGTVAAP